MAQIKVTTLHDGPQNAHVQVSIIGDETGDVTDETLIDPATSFAIPLPSKPALRLVKIWYDLIGFDAFLEFDYLASDTPLWSMSNGQGTPLDFSCFGGLTDRSNELDGSGKLMLTTSGLGEGDFGSIVLDVKKS